MKTIKYQTQLTFAQNMTLSFWLGYSAVKIVQANIFHFAFACAVEEPLLFNVWLTFYLHQLDFFSVEKKGEYIDDDNDIK